MEDLLVAARARVERVAVDVTTVDLVAELDTVLASTPQVSGRGISSASKPVTAIADPVRVRQILRNLLTNAVRYGGGDIWVRVDQANGTASVQVLDDGAGVSPSESESIFDRYHSARSATQPGAVGLGLTVSRELARLMGGEVTYRRERGHSCFELTLPAGS